MALIDCPECSKEVSDKAPSCPNCGIVFEPRETPISSDTFAESKTEKVSKVIWWVWKAHLYLLISAALTAAYFIPMVVYIMYQNLYEGRNWPTETIGVCLLFLVGTCSLYFGFTRGWRVMHRSTGWKILSRWENKQNATETEPADATETEPADAPINESTQVCPRCGKDMFRRQPGKWICMHC